eukprot:scaffold2845_cov147-Skeletonema_marinoi.AAC.1
MSSASKFQQQFYAYISTFDGNKKDFWHPDMQYKFNCIMHQSCAGIDDIRLVHANMFALGSKAICFIFRRMTADVFFVKFRLVNWKTDVTIEQLVTVKDGRIVQVQASHPGDDDGLSTANSRTHQRYAMNTCQSRPDMCMQRPNLLMHRHHKSEGKIRASQMHPLRT